MNNFYTKQTQINELYNTPSDINEHIPILIKYANECNFITEMGVRWVVSTWVWLACAPKKLISYDLYNPSHWGRSIEPVIETAKYYGLNFECFCSAINSTFNNFCSIYYDLEVYFGSVGSFFNLNPIICKEKQCMLSFSNRLNT